MERALLAIIPAASLILSGGCERRAAPAETTSSNPTRTNAEHPTLPNTSSSDQVRATFAQLGIAIPQLRLFCHRKGRDIVAFEVSSESAIATWERIRAVTNTTGYYPLVVRDERGLLTDLSDNDLPGSPEEVLQKADRFDIEAWLKARKRDLLAGNPPHDIPRGQPKPTKPTTRFAVPFDTVSSKPVTGVYILLLPTKLGSEVPAILMYGDWNGCPKPEAHVALLRSWHDRYGAEPVTLGGDVLELKVARRPSSVEESLRLAEEQYLYCNDIVDPMSWNIDMLAVVLRESDIWFFWWN